MDVVPVHAAEALDADRVPALEVGAVKDGGVRGGRGDRSQVGVYALKIGKDAIVKSVE